MSQSAMSTPTVGQAPRAALVPGFASVDVRQRIGARLVDGFMQGMIIGLAYVILVLGAALTRSAGLTLLAFVVFLAVFPVIGLLLPYRLSSLVGYAAMGYRFVDIESGRPAGTKVVAKYLLEGAIPFGGLVAVVSMDEDHRNWYDRLLGVQLVCWDESRLTSGAEGLRRPSAAPAPPPPALPPSASAVPQPAPLPIDATEPIDAISPAVSIRLDDGSTLALMTPVLLGRDPSPAAAVPGGTPRTMADPGLSISKTHLAVGLDDGTPWAMDLRSTNGSQVERNGSVTPLVPWVRTPIAPGDVVRFGDRSLRVTGGGHD
ncbi:MAG: hypothetical protein M9891_00100 [Austwickia sp.]|nr:RDD family protein [Austwickia sp.]MCO5307695.1 hypothetical protein [Austwickia sp.]